MGHQPSAGPEERQTDIPMLLDLLRRLRSPDAQETPHPISRTGPPPGSVNAAGADLTALYRQLECLLARHLVDGGHWDDIRLDMDPDGVPVVKAFRAGGDGDPACCTAYRMPDGLPPGLARCISPEQDRREAESLLGEIATALPCLR